MEIAALSRRLLISFSVCAALGIGCGGGLGSGCGSLGALPTTPGPWGLPPDQTIEGGLQARITKPGFDKLSAVIPALTQGALPTQQKPLCMPRNTYEILGVTQLSICNAACGGGAGCPTWVDLRPDIAPPSGVVLSMADGTNPVVKVDAAFDVHMVMPLQVRFWEVWRWAWGSWNTLCSLHIDSPGTHVAAGIQLGIDPTSGRLTMSLADISLKELNLKTSNCGIASDIFNFVVDIIDSVASSFVGDTIIGLIRPELDSFVRGFLPNPPGLAGVISTAGMLASFNPPPEAALETLLVAGGYVSAKNGGLNVGVIAGMNSDRDQSTRGSGATSEASLCVPTRPVIDVAGPPWNLQPQGQRPTHVLSPADPFSGDPDPVDANGKLQDVAIGVSRTFLDLAGFHAYNSGTLCLSLSGNTLSVLTAGTLSALVPSLGNIVENKKAPLALTLRPTQPLRFGIGEGTATDPLLRIAATDLRADFYAFIEERYVRVFTLALDMNVGVNLTVTMGADGKPALAPVITGIDKTNVQARVSNTDLLAEDPARIAKTLLSLIDVAIAQIGGAIKPIVLPQIAGFSLDQLQLARVRTAQDDFLGIFGSLAQSPSGSLLPIMQAVVSYERIPNGIETTAQVIDVNVPPPEVIRDALQSGQLDGNVPTVTLRLGASAENPEWSYRVDGGIWQAWSSNPQPTIADPVFQLQGRHTIDVRARSQDDWATEDQTPEHLDVVIDSVPPTLNPHVDGSTINFGGSDNVSDPSQLRYAWETPQGQTEPGRRDYLSFDEAWEATGHAASPLTVTAWDEVGNQRVTQYDLGQLSEFQARLATTSTSGCGCTLSGTDHGPPLGAVLVLLPLFGFLVRRRGARRV